MLATIGVASVDELFRDIPQAVRFGRELDLEPALSEQEVFAHLAELAARNADASRELSFLGAGIYDHYVPAVVDTILQRGEFLTAYTPYQPEMSQGVLQAIFEYQTAICELTGMDVSNASGYDGTTVAADACYVAKHATGRDKIVVTEATNPQVRQVVKTYAPGFGLEVVEVPHRNGTTDPDELERAAVDAAAVIFQQPNFFGCLEPAPELVAAAAEAGALADRARRPPVARRARGAGPLRRRARDRRGTGCRELPVLRRAALRLPRGAPGVHPPHAGPHRRRDGRHRGRARLCPHPADPRAAHPAGEGHLEHHHEPDAARARRARLSHVARAAGAARAGGDLPVAGRVRESSASRSGRDSNRCLPIRQRSRSLPFASDGMRARSSRTRASVGVHPGYALGRDYEGMDDVLLVAVTERRTPEEIDRLADVLAEVAQ